MLNDLKVDAIIASDGGVIEILKEYAKDVEIHVSTQANTVKSHTRKRAKQRTNKRNYKT